MSSLPRCFAIADTIHPVRPARALAGIVRLCRLKEKEVCRNSTMRRTPCTDADVMTRFPDPLSPRSGAGGA